MIATESCPHCESAKNLLKDEIDLGVITVVDEKSDRYKNLVEKFDLDAVPAFIVDDEKCCKLTGNKDKFHLECQDGSIEKIQNELKVED